MGGELRDLAKATMSQGAGHPPISTEDLPSYIFVPPLFYCFAPLFTCFGLKMLQNCLERAMDFEQDYIIKI